MPIIYTFTMVQIVDVLNKYVRPYKRTFIFVAILAVFIYAIYYWSTRNKIEPPEFDDVANSSDRQKEAIVYFFHANWCPHCKKAAPEWDSFKLTHHDKVINGYIIKCQDVDCTDESNTTSNTLINRFHVDSYPTVKMERDGTIIDFDSKVTSSSLGSFATMMLND